MRRPGCVIPALDQFIVRHPEYFFSPRPNMRTSSRTTLRSLVNHLKCAAFELPLEEGECFGAMDLSMIRERLAEAGYLHRSGRYWHWTQETYPADAISLRSISSDNFINRR